MALDILVDAEIYRDNRTVRVDGAAFATAKDQHRAEEIVKGLQSGQRLAAARQYVRSAIETYASDPADSDFQRGYLAALETIEREALGVA